MAQVISYGCLTGEAQVQMQARLCGICDGQSGTGPDCSLGNLSVSFHQCTIPIDVSPQHNLSNSSVSLCILIHLKMKEKLPIAP